MTKPGRSKPRTDLHVALLRGINVGGKNKLPMNNLKALFEAVGCSDVQTYIASGNVIFSANAKLAKRIPELISKTISDRFGLQVPVVARTAKQLHTIAAKNPLLKRGVDDSKLHIGFLASRPSAKLVKTLDPDRSPPDRFVLTGRELYLHCPNGMARTKLTNDYFDSRLDTTSTVRNWKTVLKLVEMTASV